ncbi:MAG: hypothetical protein ACRD2B_04050 [Terriglobia bacterium]
MAILPCVHEQTALDQINPTIDLLRNLDNRCPDVLRSAGVVPEDYHPKRIFRSAVETIRGSFIASSLTQRHQMVAGVLSRLVANRKIAAFEPTQKATRHDFTIILTDRPRVAAALDVKGGEGNSITITERPPWAQEFVMWCHLDGSIINQPSQGVHSIVVNRLANDLMRRGKLVDAIFFKDQLCGSPLRRCPKYRGSVENDQISPDVFLMPRERPTPQQPFPRTHSPESLYLPEMVLDIFGVSRRDHPKHIWLVEIHLVSVTKRGKQVYMRRTRILHRNKVVEESVTNA